MTIREHCLVLLIVQCLKNGYFIYFASCVLIVVLGERISCIPVTSLCLEVEASY